MNRHELARVLLDEIVRMRAQLLRLRMVLTRRTEERISRMSQCGECERLWRAYQTATIESVQLYEELRSITDDEGSREVERNDNQSRSCRAATSGGSSKAGRTSGGNRASVSV
jgi:hypothetical protein